MELTRGDICLVDFNPVKGGEIGKLRPAIIMSSSEDNSILQTIIVIPLSTIIEDDTLPYRFSITKRQKLEKTSDACIYEIRALAKIRVKSKIAQITSSELNIIQNAICDIVKN